MAIVVPGRSWREISLWKLERGTKKEKSSKKERKEGLWKLTLLMEIRKERGFPQQLEKSLAKDARLFHSSHRPNNKDLSTMYCRQRSTLRRLNFGPKDGEHLSSLRTKRTAKRILKDCWGRGLNWFGLTVILYCSIDLGVGMGGVCQKEVITRQSPRK